MPRSTPRFKLFSARRDRTAAMPFIMLTALIDMISIGLIIPVLPALVGSFTGSQMDVPNAGGSARASNRQVLGLDFASG